MNYEYKHMNEGMKDEVGELLAGDHGKAVVAFGKECGNAAVEGFKRGLVKGCVKASLLGVAGATLVVGAYRIGKSIVKACTEKGVERIIKNT